MRGGGGEGCMGESVEGDGGVDGLGMEDGSGRGLGLVWFV